MLSKRLQIIAELVPENASICDVGTDHGYLAIHLYNSGKCRSVIACDINEKPLLSAKNNIEKAGIDKISLRLCDGLSGIEKDETNTIIIAGMGGEVISGIISRCDWIKDSDITLILQPMTSPEALRRYLYSNGFEITAEIPLSENQKIYSVIKAVFCGTVPNIKPFNYYIGKILPNTEDGISYIKKQLKRFQKCCNDLSDVKRKQDEYLQYKEILTDLSHFLEDSHGI